MAVTDAAGLHLRTVVPYVSGESIAVTDLGDRIGLSRGEVVLLTRFLGLDRVATAGQLTTPDMLLDCGERALAGVDRSRVRYLIHGHTMSHVVPAGLRPVDQLRRKLGLDQARAFTMSHLDCVTGLFALRVVERLLRAEPADATALILLGEKVLTGSFQHLPGTTLLGDAAAAALVGLGGPGDALVGLARRTLGGYHQGSDMPAELRHRYHRSYVPTLAAVMRDALDDAGLRLDDVSLVLPHNVNRFSWHTTAKDLGLPTDRIFLANVPKLAHCFGADPFLNLATARAAGAVRPGDTLLLVSAGQSGMFCAVVVRAGEDG
ncbi:3-oxoacyl-[acyl-carrier-protein] synthase III C-terminal domain-containing protein [Solwaraspora sp. WMMD1047]|uniref:3-oxoacyl-[acyl-carrier-protein] synthase III C-terminal domain-containing protein n=1 Tax=Solwaraspora sp. WMMD1047 TaxID=3016102 RepID=UPI00241772AD|nr:3-oxoacyl-[acyl-carrier-protein] synthase III C-terminal domain-containing protein [Solwaraspora sp. WMMD1047]MDG4830666.1 3-oxoacyl-[acyl-carrier-protein] synthase III C-terminal domain-containing protein [Solwaraspora sp. WMMD1047]